jgi:uncharacterized protein
MSIRTEINAIREELSLKETSIFLLAPILLTLQHYWAKYAVLSTWLKPLVAESHLEIWGSLSWCASIALLYAFIPSLWIYWGLKESPWDYGWRWNKLHRHLMPYLLFFGLMLLPIIFAASTPAFQKSYPFFAYVKTSWMLFILWQLAYACQFVAVEFFFRGFMSFGLYRRFGSYAFLISSIPYCMIHYGKPMGESLGAIVAGIVLAHLAYKNRSIWGGALLHWLVALSMDLASLLLSRSA